MRKIVFAVLGVIVIAIVAVFCVREFTVPNINYVGDSFDYAPWSSNENSITIQRLYSAAVDFDAYNKALEEIIDTTEYTEEERLAAAIASGVPEFFPSFNLSAYRTENEVRVSGFIDIGTAKGQKNNHFKMGNISLETIVGGDCRIDRVEVLPYSTSEEEERAITRIHSQNQAAIDISKARMFEIVLVNNNEDGEIVENSDFCSVTLQFVYNVDSDSFFSKTVLTDQLVLVNAAISIDEFGKTTTEWTAEPFSNMEDYNNAAD
ncbi:MAG: hypothetical protein FWF82_07200 [Oscillospiraceae bacterium]|nr:hypothetical protein [Oscillospiraceae bacterium]